MLTRLGLLFDCFVAYLGRRRRCLWYWFRLAFCADVPLVVALISRVAKMADTRCEFYFLCSCSRRPRCDKVAQHDANTSSRNASQGPDIGRLSLNFRARDASRTGWSKKSRLEVDVGAIIGPNNAQK